MRSRVVAVAMVFMLVLSGCAADVPENTGTATEEATEETVPEEADADAEAEGDAAQDTSKEEEKISPEESISGEEETEANAEEASAEENADESSGSAGDEAVEEEEGFAREPGNPTGCAIWAMTDIDIMDGEGSVVGVLAAGECSAVIGVDDEAGLFEITEGFIDSSLCMIDLAEYLGDAVSFSIASAVSSVFAVSGYSVDGITGEVLPGYEGRTDTENVPLLYPAAQKLLTAAEIAAGEGYVLQIVEAYRPYEATRYLYDTMTERLYDDAGNGETYYSLMTNDGEYLVSAFLAKSRSSHNYGVALDLRLLDEEGDVISAQTDIHDLSYGSALVYNNDAANELSAILQEAGFSTIFSEWWHFQDNDAYDELKAIGIDIAALELEMNKWKKGSLTGSLSGGQRNSNPHLRHHKPPY